MKWIKNEMPMRIGEIVSRRTGMNREDLLNDTKEYHINNMDEAVSLFIDHVKAGHKIKGFCDYDTDGINCANEMKVLAKALNYPIEVYVPHRFSDGYGIKPRHIENFKDCQLLILCDNGIAANEAVDKAREYGIDVLILDHHEKRVDESGQEMIPNANVIVDPHVTGADFDDYCGAGLVYIFSKKVLERCNYLTSAQKKAAIKKINAFAAIGTVGDVVNLTQENRRIVKDGLNIIMNHEGTTGLNALLGAMHLLDYLTSIDVAFTISPTFNAAGRLEDDGAAFVSDVVAFDSRNVSLIEDNVLDLQEMNKKRKEISVKRFIAMDQYIQENHLEQEHFLVLIDEDGTPGINGLTAGKITEKYKRPCIVMSPTADPNLVKGSGRAPEWVNLKSALDQNNALIAAYGGHPEACGITMERSKIKDFIAGLNKITPDIPDYAFSDILYYDIECRPCDAPNVAEAAKDFGPYGAGNPEIVVRINNIDLMPSKRDPESYEFYMGQDKQHVKLFSEFFDILWFDGTEKYNAMGAPKKISIVGTLSMNVWNGRSRLQIQVIDLIAM